MTTRHTARGIGIFALSAVFSLSAPGWFGQPSSHAGEARQVDSCGLQRVGTQFVRCDNLTGAGVAAASWIREPARPCPLQQIGEEWARCDNLTGARVGPAPRTRPAESCPLQQIGQEWVRCDNLSGSRPASASTTLRDPAVAAR